MCICTPLLKILEGFEIMLKSTNIYFYGNKMFLLGIFLLCSVNPLLLKAFPVESQVNSKEPSDLTAHLSDPADYPDLTNGLTDAEVQESLQDLSLDDLNSLDKLLDEHIGRDVEVDSDASRRTQVRQAKATERKQDLRSVNSPLDDGCRDEEDSDDAKPNLCSKRPTCPTTKRCPKKTTSVPKTTRMCATRPVNENCKSKSGGYMDDDMINDTTKCQKPKNKKCKKPKDDFECEADDFLCHASRRSRGKQSRSNLQEEQVDAPAEYVPAKELTGLEQLNEEMPAMNDQGEPLDETFNLGDTNLDQSSRVDQSSSEFEPKVNLGIVNQVVNSEQEHQSEFEKDNPINSDQKHQSNLKKDYEINLGDTKLDSNYGVNLEETKLDSHTNLKQESSYKVNLEGTKMDSNTNLKHESNYGANLEETNLDSNTNLKQESNYEVNLEDPKMDSNTNLKHESNYGASLDSHSNLKQESQANLNHEFGESVELDNHRNSEQANIVNLKQEDQVNFDQDYLADFEQEHPTNLELRNPVNVRQSNQISLDQEQQLKMDFGNPDHFQQEHPTNLDLENQYNYDQEYQLSLGNKHQANFDDGHQANLHQKEQQLNQDQKISHIEAVEQVENEPVAEPSPLDPYERHTLARIAHRKREQAAAEKANEEIIHNVEDRNQKIFNDEPKPLNADLTKQEPLFDSDSFIASNARDPPRYLIQMQNDCIQSEDDRGERRLREDRSQSETLNLDKLAEEQPSPLEDSNFEYEYKRSKRENKETDDDPEKRI
ncbi:heat shock protein DDB_G0288861 isoform X2 [Drosophila suzukii]|uniref:Heat shock protein DDB_G0288861 isoform X2 n=1 Tax=Drosophila suzukii TaxID=28584 RepID=A0AB39ZGL1_DROSZ